jgi:hypothetical protein
MAQRLNRSSGRLAAALLTLGLAAGAAQAQQATAPPSKAPVTINQADIDALRAMLAGSSSTSLEALNALNGAEMRPDGTVVHQGPSAERPAASVGAKMATAFGGLVSDHGTYASFVDASNTRLDTPTAAPNGR